MKRIVGLASMSIMMVSVLSPVAQADVVGFPDLPSPARTDDPADICQLLPVSVVEGKATRYAPRLASGSLTRTLRLPNGADYVVRHRGNTVVIEGAGLRKTVVFDSPVQDAFFALADLIPQQDPDYAYGVFTRLADGRWSGTNMVGRLAIQSDGLVDDTCRGGNGPRPNDG